MGNDRRNIPLARDRENILLKRTFETKGGKKRREKKKEKKRVEARMKIIPGSFSNSGDYKVLLRER